MNIEISSSSFPFFSIDTFLSFFFMVFPYLFFSLEIYSYSDQLFSVHLISMLVSFSLPLQLSLIDVLHSAFSSNVSTAFPVHPFPAVPRSTFISSFCVRSHYRSYCSLADSGFGFYLFLSLSLFGF